MSYQSFVWLTVFIVTAAPILFLFWVVRREVRLRVSCNVLTQLAQRSKTGLELVKDSNGAISRMTVYVWLAIMEDDGLIEGAEATPRRVYNITKLGAKTLADILLG